jgi:hypothetical protein
MIGTMRGERTRWSGAAKALVGICLSDRYDDGDDDAEGLLLPTPVPAIGAHGWSRTW